MLLPRFQQVYTPQNASAIALLLLTTFFFFDSYHWHILPFPWYPSTSSTTNPNDLQSNSNDSTNIVLTTLTTVNKLNSTNASLVGGANETIPNKLNQSRKSNNIATNASHASPTTMAFPESNSTASTIHPPPEILSLRRLEAGLRTARSALRKVVLEKNATRALQAQELTGEYSPWGPIYRDASIFQQSYLEMEKRFRVFVYPEGEEPLVHNGPCKEIYSTEGRFIQELQETNPFVTKDPLKAHVFFLPFSVSMMVTYLYKPKSRDMSPLLHFVKDYVEVVASKYPFWNRSQGADHFMLSCHDWGPHVSKAHPHLEKHAIRVLCNANRSEGYVPDKDASLAEINLVGGYIPAELGGPPMKERPHLAFFAGQDHGPVRPILYKYWEGKDDDVKVFHKVPAEYSYQELMKKSKFCLCPGGYEVNSPRIVEAIYNDCIPVVIADSFVLPFSDVLDWDAFSLRVMENDIPKLKKILQAVPVAKYEEMQERVRQVQRHFLLNQPPQRYDLFHMILHSVWLRRLNIRLNYY